MNKVSLLAIVMILAAVILAVFSFWNDSYVVDEVPHLGAGYSYITQQDMRLNPEHPPLAKIVGAFPLLFMDTEDVYVDDPLWSNNTHYSQWDLGRQLLFDSGVNPDKALRWVKFFMLSFFVGAALIVFRWTRERLGDHAGLLALGLFAFSPTVLGHSRLVTTDMPAVFGVLLACYLFARWLEDSTRKRFWYWIIGLGVALLTKFSTIVLLPLFVIVVLIFAPKKLFIKTILGIALAFIVVVWPAYTVLNFNNPTQQQVADTERNLASAPDSVIKNAILQFDDTPLIRHLDYYALGLYKTTERSSGGNEIFFRGELVQNGPWYYFPFVYFIKEPLAFWALAFIALLAGLRKFRNLRFALLRTYPHELVIVGFLIVYWAVSLQSDLHIGVRHIIPVYPFIIMLVAAAVVYGYQHSSEKYKTLYRYVVSVLLLWYALASIYAFPHYISYFNQSIGGSDQGHNVVADSNLDWGQDIKRLAHWQQENGIERIALHPFSWSDIGYYFDDRMLWIGNEHTIDKATFLSDAGAKTNGWLAVSGHWFTATKNPLTGDRHYAWLDAYEPVTVIGNSIFVYNIR